MHPYTAIVAASLLMTSAAGEVLVEAGVGNGEDRDGAVTDDGDAAAGLSYTERFFVGFVSGVIIVVCVICYLHCRKGAVESLELSKPSPAVYSVVSSDDVERGCMSLELSSRGSRGSSGEDEQDAQNWDDWEQENSKDESRGEFIQYSNYVNVATTVSAPPILAAVRANTSSGSLGKLSSRSISPSVSKRRPSARDSRQQKSSPIGDDLFASIGISAAPTFKEAAPSPSVFTAASIGKSQNSSPSVQRRLSDVMAEDDGASNGGWIDDDDDLDV